MKAKIFFIFLGILCGVGLVSADDDASGEITGVVIDSDSNEPLGYVNVSIRKQHSDEVLLLGAMTDEDGTFSIGNVPFDSYTLRVSYLGYDSFEREITLSAGSNAIVLEPIILRENAQLLGEVQVVGIRSQMRMDIDRRVFNVDQNIASTGGSANDILTNIPSIEVDSEGSISLRGNSSVTVWINGKASGLTADNRSQILDQLPAETIERVEVITNPSARYSPEGTAGIINIILKQDRNAGYYGSAQVGADTFGGYNASVNYNYSSSRLDAYAGLSYRRFKMRGGGYNNRLNISETDTTFLNQETDNDGHNNNIFARLGGTYHLTPRDHFTVGTFGMFGGGNYSSEINYLSNMPNSFLSSRRLSSNDNDMTGGNVEIGYKHDFSDTHYIDFTASYNIWNMDGTSVYNQNSIFADNVESSSYQRQGMNMESRNWDIQLDYQNVLQENHKIEAGYKGTLSREDSPIETYSGTSENNAIPETGLFNRFIYDLDVHALYGTYSGRLGNLSYQAGLRGEYSNMTSRSLGYNQVSADVNPLKNDYFSLFPSAFISYSLPNNNEIQINYSRRISRPWGGQLNSFVNITDSSNISFGNPALNPQYSNAFELNYIKTWDEHMLSFSGYYRTTDDVIQRISYRDGNVMKSTYENVTKSTSAGTEIVVKNQLFRILDLTTTVNLFYYKLGGFSYTPTGATSPVTGESRDDFSWNARVIGNLRLPGAYILQLTGNYNAKQVVAQGHRKANYSLDAGLQKSFDKVSISISARDILDSRKWSTVTSGQGFNQKSKFWGGGRQFSLTLTYNFGNMNARRPNNRPQGEGAGGGYNMNGGGMEMIGY